MPYQIRRAAVLGAGVMGAAIAAHLANAGIPSLLLDIVPPDAAKDRDKIARGSLEKAINARPAVFYSKRAARLVAVGNIEDDLEELADVDWIVEAVVERVVICKDTPNFIANRIGIYGFMSVLQRALNEGYTVGEVDAILGPSMGRPKSAIFRTGDLSGLDTTVHVADNLYKNAPDDEQRDI